MRGHECIRHDDRAASRVARAAALERELENCTAWRRCWSSPPWLPGTSCTARPRHRPQRCWALGWQIRSRAPLDAGRAAGRTFPAAPGITAANLCTLNQSVICLCNRLLRSRRGAAPCLTSLHARLTPRLTPLCARLTPSQTSSLPAGFRSGSRAGLRGGRRARRLGLSFGYH
jgi:hypothetical protein